MWLTPRASVTPISRGGKRYVNAERTAALSIFVCDTKYSPTTVLDVDGARALSSSFQQVVGPNPCPMTTGAFRGRWGLTQQEVAISSESDRQSRAPSRLLGPYEHVRTLCRARVGREVYISWVGLYVKITLFGVY